MRVIHASWASDEGVELPAVQLRSATLTELAWWAIAARMPAPVEHTARWSSWPAAWAVARRAPSRTPAAGARHDGRPRLVELAAPSAGDGQRHLMGRLASALARREPATLGDLTLVAGSEAFVARVGDCRSHSVGTRWATRIMTDHSFTSAIVVEGRLTIASIPGPVGVAADVGVELAYLPLRVGDQLMVCTDGVCDYVPAARETGELLSWGDPEQALVALLELARDRSHDVDITALVAEVVAIRARSEVVALPEAGVRRRKRGRHKARRGAVAR